MSLFFLIFIQGDRLGYDRHRTINRVFRAPVPVSKQKEKPTNIQTNKRDSRDPLHSLVSPGAANKRDSRNEKREEYARVDILPVERSKTLANWNQKLSSTKAHENA